MLSLISLYCHSVSQESACCFQGIRILFKMVSSYISSSQESNLMLCCLGPAFHVLFSFKIQNALSLTVPRYSHNMPLSFFPSYILVKSHHLKILILIEFLLCCNHFIILSTHSQGLSTLSLSYSVSQLQLFAETHQFTV